MHNLAEGSKHESVESALRSAFRKVDEEVQNIVHWSFQGNPFAYKNTFFVAALVQSLHCFPVVPGSTACAVVIHENISNGTRSIISANVGDSRAILSRNGAAIELTKVKTFAAECCIILLCCCVTNPFVSPSRITNQMMTMNENE